MSHAESSPMDCESGRNSRFHSTAWAMPACSVITRYETVAAADATLPYSALTKRRCAFGQSLYSRTKAAISSPKPWSG